MSFYSLTTVLGFLILFEPWTFSFMDPFSFSFKLLRLANFDQSWQSCKNAKTKKQLTFGEFCYLPAALCPFLEKVASQNSTQGKSIKWATKRAVKKDNKRKKKNARKEYWKQIPPPSQKKTNFLSKCSKVKKKLLNYIQLAEKLGSISAVSRVRSWSSTAAGNRAYRKVCFEC